MFERFTGDSRQAIVGALQEARELGRDQIGSEHLLLGVVSLGAHDAALTVMLRAHRVTPESARAAAAARFARGEEHRAGQLPFTANTKSVLELALREALVLKSGGIAPAHILLGCCALPDSSGARSLLSDLEVDLEALRSELARTIEGDDAIVAAAREVWHARQLLELTRGEDAVARFLAERGVGWDDVKQLLEGLSDGG